MLTLSSKLGDFTSSLRREPQKYVLRSMLHVINDIIVLWRCYCRRRRCFSSSQKKISRRGLAELKLHQKACRTCSIVIFPPSTNEKSLICDVDVAVAVVISLGSFSIDDGDGNGNDNTTNKQFDWSSEGNKPVARVTRNYEQVCAIVCKTTT